MEGHRLACLLPLLLKALQAAGLEQRSAAAGHLAAGMQAGPAAGSSAVLELAAGIRPVLQDCLTSCREAGEYRR